MPLRRLGSVLALASGLGAASAVLVACGGPKEAEDPHVVESAGLAPTEETAPAMESVDTPLTELERAKVVEAIDKGFAVFLQRAVLKDVMQDGKFVGWRIVRFAVPEDWRGVGLLVGDVITSVNDMPIEHPEQGHAVFVSLRTAPALEVAYLRDGKPMRLSLPIVGQAPPPEPAEKTASTPAPAAIEPSSAPAKDPKPGSESSAKKR